MGCVNGLRAASPPGLCLRHAARHPNAALVRDIHAVCCHLASQPRFVLAVNRKKRIPHHMVGDCGSKRLTIVAGSSEVNAAKYAGISNLLKRR
jgi:hypothetical protein